MAESTSAAPADLRVALRHHAWRWAGAPLFFSGALIFFWAFGEIPRGGRLFTAMLGFGGMMMGLTAFGANHDAAVSYALRAQVGGGELPPKLQAELDEELRRDREAVNGLKPSPKVALVLPFTALALQAYVVYRIIQMWGVKA